ncbi:MAG: esterase YqiA, partial [Proteobacteria bacterium]|nr:esterase YqiA [Pseudomonadota bacterium]
STGEKFIINQDQLDLLDAMAEKIKTIKPGSNYMVLLQSLDEVLDYRAALSFYRGAYLNVTYGGSHSFENFEDYFQKIRLFLNLH